MAAVDALTWPSVREVRAVIAAPDAHQVFTDAYKRTYVVRCSGGATTIAWVLLPATDRALHAHFVDGPSAQQLPQPGETLALCGGGSTTHYMVLELVTAPYRNGVRSGSVRLAET